MRSESTRPHESSGLASRGPLLIEEPAVLHGGVGCDIRTAVVILTKHVSRTQNNTNNDAEYSRVDERRIDQNRILTTLDDGL